MPIINKLNSKEEIIMVKLLIGKKGTGKTKILIDSVNEAATNANGNVVFISNNTGKNMYDIKSKVRMADTSEFKIDSWKEFFGFISGIISSNFDITNVYIDGTLKIVNNSLEGFEQFLEDVDGLGKKFNFETMISVSMDIADAPEYLKKYQN